MHTMVKGEVKRGNIFIARIMSKGEGSSVQAGMRPVIVVSNDLNNRFSPVVTVVPVTSKVNSKSKLPTHILLRRELGLRCDSLALCEQVMPIDKSCLVNKIGDLDEDAIEQVNTALNIQLGIEEPFSRNEVEYKIENIKEVECQLKNNENDFLKKCLYIAVTELKTYCRKYGRDYTNYMHNIANVTA